MSISSTIPAGIYIHVPFCQKKCGYCDFYSVTALEKISVFVQAAIEEIRNTDLSVDAVDTIYFGGGTPSILEADNISALMNAIGKKLALSNEVEITIEANPGTINLNKLTQYRSGGINRINIGVQSFHDPILKLIGRIHTSKEALIAIDLARKTGFDNVGIDLMYGLPEQTQQMWHDDLEAAINLAPEHISCYTLTYEKGTLMAADLEKEKIQAIPEEESAAMFEMTDKFLTDAGYIHYEISNYARSHSMKSRHNLKYWSFAPYIGIGPAAHSFINYRRSWNVRSVDEYIKRIKSGMIAVDSTEVLDIKQQIIEEIYLGLRCDRGINFSEFKKKFDFGFEEKFSHIISVFASEGYMNRHEGFCRLSLKGMMFLDGIVERFVYEI